MILDYCPTCGVFLTEPIHGPDTWEPEAIAAWHREIAETCQHEPHCTGPWQHAVRAIREAHDRGIKTGHR